MKPRTATLALIAFAAALVPLPAPAAGTNGFTLEVLADGAPLPELYTRGTVYVEALRERPYAIRITNPLGVRVAVALAVDGRNTIDAKRTSARGASKWILEPYESTVISGWQVDGETSRRFTFTTERKSYAAWLGDASNLGVVEAVFYREKPVFPPPPRPRPYLNDQAPVPASPYDQPLGSSAAPRQSGKAEADMAPRAPSSSRQDALAEKEKKSYEPAGEAAATGMGDATRHDVVQVAIDLESRPAALLRIRYEYRQQLVSLGLLPRDTYPPSRRERSTGFDSYCPEPRYR